MSFGRKLKFLRKKKPRGLVAVEGSQSQGYLIASTEQPLTAQPNIRSRLKQAGLIAEAFDPKTAVKLTSAPLGDVDYPDDYADFQDYLDAYNYMPFVARAVDVKQAMIWEAGYTLESKDEGSVASIEDFLVQIEADTVIREGTLWALLFGNMYWHVERGNGIKLTVLNPAVMGIKLSEKDEVQQYVYQPEFGKVIRYKPEEIIHLKFNAEPWKVFGVSSLRRCLPTIKALLYMEEKLPLIARRRADPLLQIQIGSSENPVDEATFNRHKNAILSRKPGEDIFHDGLLEITEVYQTGGIGARQTLEPLLAHFRQNLVAGVGVPDVALGFGGTTTMATAEYQERLLESEIRAYQRALKRLHENQLFTFVRTRSPVKLNWRPFKPEDMEALSKKMQGEIQHGVVGPAYARQRLGYPDEAGEGTVINSQLIPFLTVKKKPEGEKES